MDSQELRLIRSLQRRAASLLLYQGVLQDPIGQAFLNLLQTLQHKDDLHCLQAYGQWFSALATQQRSWQDHLLMQILWDDNAFTQQAQQSECSGLARLPSVLVDATQHDLRVLQSLYLVSGQQLSQWVQSATDLSEPPTSWSFERPSDPHALVSVLHAAPVWHTLTRCNDWGDAVEALAAHYSQNGVGVFAQYRAFRWQSGRLDGIAHPDPVQLEELVGYELQQAALVQNTEALLAGYRALHVLLYGSRGSGKSSLVKGLLHRYGDRGLRLIEVAKSDLRDLATIVDRLRHLPQRFIIFVDDLSFEEDDDAYKALKVVLEGNVTARPANVVVYATSNRRHLIREFFGDRPRPSDADEIHSWDTVQEKLSFSDRFGLTLTFEPADQPTYLAIVHHLAKLAQIEISPDDLDFRALQWATRHNGRSGRTARQFVDFLKTEEMKDKG